MPVNQPRDRAGRFGAVPATTPTPAQRAPSRPVRDPQDRNADAVTRAYRVFTSSTAPDTQAADTPEAWARTYHTRFRRFDQRTLDATKALLRSRPSQMTPSERDAVFAGWIAQISAIYRMPTPTLRWDTSADRGGGGYYLASDHSITMSPNHPSVVTLIHETRHALQHARAGAPMVSDDVERDARAWSLSLYYRVRPALFRRMVRDGQILHIDRTVFD